MGDVMRITSSLFSQCHLVLTKEKYCVLYASARFLQDSCQNGPPYLAPLNEDLADILGTMLWQCDNCNSIFWVLRWMRLSYLRSQLRIVFIFVFSGFYWSTDSLISRRQPDPSPNAPRDQIRRKESLLRSAIKEGWQPRLPLA